MLASFSRLLYDDEYHVYNGRGQFVGKFYLFSNVFLLSIGVLVQKKIVTINSKTSLPVLCFYIYLTAFLISIVVYNIKYWNDKYSVSSTRTTLEAWTYYWSPEYLKSLGNMMMIYGTLCMVEAYGYITLMYINKKGHISKVTLYGALHGFYVIIIWLVFEEAFWNDFLFIAAITFAYAILFFSKYSMSRVVKINSAKTRIKFKRAITGDEMAEKIMSTSNIQMEGKYFYESSYNRASMKTTLFDGSASGTLKSSYNGNGSRKGDILKYSNANKFENLVSTMNLKMIEENNSEETISLDDTKGFDQENQKKKALLANAPLGVSSINDSFGGNYDRSESNASN